jgi:UDP-glucose 4-epimerase
MGKSVRHLIIGGGGFVGSWVAQGLADRGIEVTVGARRGLSPPMLGVASSTLNRIELDVRSADWDELLKNVDVIHHYAWSSVPQSAAVDPARDIVDHLPPLLKMLEAASKAGGKKVLFISSGGTVYGRQIGELACEDDSPRPLTVYGVTKLAAESYLRVFHETGQVDCCVARLSNPYGLGQNLDKRQGLVTTFLSKALAGEPLYIWGDGSVVRDYIHITDVVDALISMSMFDFDHDSTLPIFNVGTGVGHSILQVVQKMEKSLGRELKLVKHPARTVDLDRNVLDVTKAKRILGWTPNITLESGISITRDQLLQGASTRA